MNAKGGAAVTYSALKVWDADGKALPARFAEVGSRRSASGGSQIKLIVDERGARYPITIDPIAQQAYLKASNTDTYDSFGYSVAVSGDTVVVKPATPPGSMGTRPITAPPTLGRRMCSQT